MTPPSQSGMFATRKCKNDTLLSDDPKTKLVRHWERMQTGFDAARLKIMRNHRARKKHALDALHATEKYKGMNSAEREDADAKVNVDFEVRRDADLQAAAQDWKAINDISDDKDSDEDNSATESDWESPDEKEADISDHEYEVDEDIAAEEGVPYKLDEEGKVKLSDEANAELRRILEKAKNGQEIFAERVVEMSRQHGETEFNWDSEDSISQEDNGEDDEDEWTGISGD